MPPLRRYLRITRSSVLELRIYMDNPSDIPRWLTRSSTSTSSSTPLQRILSAIRPLVLPKLREENERAKGSKTKKRRGATKDTLVGEDFEVSLFLTERGAGGGGSVGHAVCVRSREMKGEGVVEIAEEEEDEGQMLEDIPAEKGMGGVEVKREDGTEDVPVELRDGEGKDDDSDDGDDAEFERMNPMTSRQRRRVAMRRDGEGEDEKKKKGAFDTTYEGFSIYGRILCLVVKRRGTGAKGGRELAGGAGQAMMEEWIGTQIRQHDDEGMEGGQG